MGSAVQSSPLTSTLTMRAFLTVFLAVAVSARRIPTPSDRCWLAALLVVLSLVSAIPELELWLDIPISTERGRLKLSLSLTLSDRSLPDITLLTLAEGRAHNVGVITNAAIAPVVHHGVVGYAGYHPYLYGKREAEAEPYYGYYGSAGVYPSVYHAGIVAPTGLGHAVAVTGYGHVTHSSNVGVCTNVAGVRFLVRWRRSRRVSYDENIRYQ